MLFFCFGFSELIMRFIMFMILLLSSVFQKESVRFAFVSWG